MEALNVCTSLMAMPFTGVIGAVGKLIASTGVVVLPLSLWIQRADRVSFSRYLVIDLDVELVVDIAGSLDGAR